MMSNLLKKKLIFELLSQEKSGGKIELEFEFQFVFDSSFLSRLVRFVINVPVVV